MADVTKHRYINLTFTGRGGGWQKTGTLAKFRQKTDTFTHTQPNFACFYIHFWVLSRIYRYFDQMFLGIIFRWVG